ncbi:hypothetical protein P3L10_027657 [Capsicum annuum]
MLHMNVETVELFFGTKKEHTSITNKKKIIFTLCCQQGIIKLPYLRKPPQILEKLLFGSGPKCSHFRDKIRSYNSMFSFTSMEEKMDASIN